MSLEIPDHLALLPGNGGLEKVRIDTRWSSAEIYLHGAHVTHFQKAREPPLLFLSESSEFAADRPIRGGVPIIFPWFGAREGHAAHGFARVTKWDLQETALLPDGAVRLAFRLPNDSFQVAFIVTVGESLTMELMVQNTAESVATVETCLHTYFEIGDIDQVSVTGLAGTRYLDKVAGTTVTEGPQPIRISSEVDRVYLDTLVPVLIADAANHRSIRVAKSGSRSTVVWNPWIEKSARMPDFGDDEYRRMLCVESGNVVDNKLTLGPGESAAMTVEITSAALH